MTLLSTSNKHTLLKIKSDLGFLDALASLELDMPLRGIQKDKNTKRQKDKKAKRQKDKKTKR